MNIISWNTTNQCHLSCPHCYRDAGANLEQELNTAEAKKMLDQIKAANFHLMIFSGGEPLLRADIFELMSYAAEIGLRPVLGTSGGLIDAEIAQKLKEAGVLAAGISLDSVQPNKHDQFRGEEGLFLKVENAFEELKKVGIPLQTHMTVMDWNLDELDIETRFRNGCLAGASYCIVNPVGDVQPSAYLDLKVGNVREENF